MVEGSLCHFFKMHIGTTIFEYLNKIKVEFVCKLLMNINLNKLDIAIEIGFNILSHFNKQFKLITGMP